MKITKYTTAGQLLGEVCPLQERVMLTNRIDKMIKDNKITQTSRDIDAFLDCLAEMLTTTKIKIEDDSDSPDLQDTTVQTVGSFF